MWCQRQSPLIIDNIFAWLRLFFYRMNYYFIFQLVLPFLGNFHISFSISTSRQSILLSWHYYTTIHHFKEHTCLNSYLHSCRVEWLEKEWAVFFSGKILLLKLWMMNVVIKNIIYFESMWIFLAIKLRTPAICIPQKGTIMPWTKAHLRKSHEQF